VDWVHLAQNMEQWWGLVNTAKYKKMLAISGVGKQ